ncbi:acyl-CoA thioester hydrolase [Melghirimyces profundicolus]|uniref:Acyl-CoA thioester hydrolase n=1 Tax=Melghirimyces profundicolus TaxID=1242148 RepID=A0A2T6C4H8_9BACL|nr:thioesterase family protein [Melghirimyces profundicolus]PTX63230.1 acyl-CoA thioester hydrolase [Melghirimyces profundicolus]
MGEPTVHETVLRVRYQETDQMGVVHHSNYAVWFEVGRTAFIREIGVSYGELEEQGILLPVVDLHCRFNSPARYEDEVRVLTRVGEMRGPKITFRYEVRRKSDNELVARGETIHMWTDRRMKRFNLKRQKPELYHLLLAHTH